MTHISHYTLHTYTTQHQACDDGVFENKIDEVEIVENNGTEEEEDEDRKGEAKKLFGGNFESNE